MECDKLSREAVKAHWDGHMRLLLTAIGKTDPDLPGLNNVLIDSYEVGTQKRITRSLPPAPASWDENCPARPKTWSG
ncbi:MAG: hypothetical protein LBT76_06385 [Tannerella sp.]|nr:hypothetical protein [Tannerella sp.]